MPPCSNYELPRNLPGEAGTSGSAPPCRFGSLQFPSGLGRSSQAEYMTGHRSGDNTAIPSGSR